MTSPALSLSSADADLEQALLASRVMVEPPEQTLLRAIGLWQERPQGTAAGPALMRRIAAALTFDSAMAEPWALGVRATGPAARQMLFTAEGRDIDLRVATHTVGGKATFKVSGQIFGPDVLGQAEIKAPGYQATLAWNDMSEFCFEDVPAGPCTLLLRSADWSIELPAFELAVGA